MTVCDGRGLRRKKAPVSAGCSGRSVLLPCPAGDGTDREGSSRPISTARRQAEAGQGARAPGWPRHTRVECVRGRAWPFPRRGRRHRCPLQGSARAGDAVSSVIAAPNAIVGRSNGLETSVNILLQRPRSSGRASLRASRPSVGSDASQELCAGMIVEQLGAADIFREHLQRFVPADVLHLEDACPVVGRLGQETGTE